MKKLLSLVVLLCLMTSLCVINAYAEDTIGVGRIDAIRAGISTSSGYRENFGFDISPIVKDGYITKSKLIVELYSGTTLLSRTTPTSKLTYPMALKTCNIVLYGSQSGSWDTIWYEPLTPDLYPTGAVIHYDNENGESKTFVSNLGLSTNPDHNKYNSFTAVTMPIVVISNGTVSGYYNTLSEAISDAPSGSTVQIRSAGTYGPLPDGGGKDITIKGTVSNVIVDLNNEEPTNYNSLSYENVGVINVPAPVAPPAPEASAQPAVENIYYIPATDDNSNMVLWGGMLLLLAATAFVTRKRKTEN